MRALTWRGLLTKIRVLSPQPHFVTAMGFVSEKPMYAVIKTGGKQYRVAPGAELKVESLVAEAGSTISFDEVLMVGEGEAIKIGAPFVAGASVKAEVIKHGRGDKIRIIKHRRRKHYHKEQGHRQNFTAVKIMEIVSA